MKKWNNVTPVSFNPLLSFVESYLDSYQKNCSKFLDMVYFGDLPEKNREVNNDSF